MLVNEDSVAETISGIEWAEFEEPLKFDKSTGFLEYVASMRKSDIVVSLHGAALISTIFLQKNSVLVELFPYNFYSRHYQTIAQRFRIKHLAWHNSTKQQASWSAKYDGACRNRILNLPPERLFGETDWQKKLMNNLRNSCTEEFLVCIQSENLEISPHQILTTLEIARNGYGQIEYEIQDSRKPDDIFYSWWWWSSFRNNDY